MRLDLAYNGTKFRGFAENEDVRTVAGELRAALEHLLDTPVEIAVAGRTDAGVHASAQVVSFTTTSSRLAPNNPAQNSRALARLPTKLNKTLAPEIAVTAATAVPVNFDARHSARSRSYQYVIRCAATQDPLQAHHQWHFDRPFDLAAMNAAAQHLVGQHDFSSFCRQLDPPISLRRNVLSALWTERPLSPVPVSPVPASTGPASPGPISAGPGRMLVFDITAWAFCHQMVRSIVGLCVAVGLGRHQPAEVPQILAAKNRSFVGKIAPPHGLTLVSVKY